MVEWRCVGFVYFLFFLVDILFIFMLLFMVLFIGGLIFILFINEIKVKMNFKDFISEGAGIYGVRVFEFYLIIGKNFFRFICDILCVFLVIVCFFSWRCCIFVKKLRTKNYKWRDFGWRKICII